MANNCCLRKDDPNRIILLYFIFFINKDEKFDIQSTEPALCYKGCITLYE